MGVEDWEPQVLGPQSAIVHSFFSPVVLVAHMRVPKRRE